ncbi:MAG: L-rhamnose mutarotase [Chloroflexota bacterium]|nr:L-rhamnose mutarotase [Chloroflexota bacterium]
MQRIAFTMHIKPGTEEEYRRRHQHVWPELLADLKRAAVPIIQSTSLKTGLFNNE